MPVRNAGAYLAPALASVLAQTFTDFELIIVNDGSTDNSWEIIEARAQEDSRIRAFRQAGQGLVPTLNRGLAKAKGRYLARMDSDDICLPQRLESQVAELDARPGLGVVGCAVLTINQQGEIIGQQTYPHGQGLQKRLLRGSLLCHPAVMGRTELFRQAGGYRAYYQHCEDYDLWLRLSALAELDNLTAPLLLYRVHKGSVTSRHATPQALGTLIAQAVHLIALRTGEDLTADLPPINAETLENLPLTVAERKGLYLRLLPMYLQTLADPGRDAFALRSLAWLTPFLEPGLKPDLAPDQDSDQNPGPDSDDAEGLHYLQRSLARAGLENN